MRLPLPPQEFRLLNSGYYHDPAHAMRTASLVGQMGHRLGWEPGRLSFLTEVALVHDADDRDGIGPGTPARVAATLSWLESAATRMGWTELEGREAQALIARTEFPFDERAGERYRALLAGLAPGSRARVMPEALALRFADQVSSYVWGVPVAEAAVQGLARELGVDPGQLWRGTSAFLMAVGHDLETDRRLATELGLPDLLLPDRRTLLRALPPRSRSHLGRVLCHFRKAA